MNGEAPDQFEMLAAPDEQTRVGRLYPQVADAETSCIHNDGEHTHICTRPQGHDGPHVAHGFISRAIAWWPNSN